MEYNYLLRDGMNRNRSLLHSPWGAYKRMENRQEHVIKNVQNGFRN